MARYRARQRLPRQGARHHPGARAVLAATEGPQPRKGRLGRDYTVGVPWLTSLEHPVAVVQLTGVLVGRDGRAIRIGAEGMLAKRSHILVSALGAQSLVSDEDLERLRTLRRHDLPNQPLVWQVALRNLVSQLTGQVAQS